MLVGVVTGSWTVEEMSAVLEAQPSMVRRHLGFWVTQGVLREGQHDMFTVVEQANDAGRNRGLGLCVRTCVCCNVCSFVSRRDGRQRLCHGVCWGTKGEWSAGIVFQNRSLFIVAHHYISFNRVQQSIYLLVFAYSLASLNTNVYVKCPYVCIILLCSQVMWSYVVGMLTNLGKLPLDRIHTMLKMFAMQGPSSSHDWSPAELKTFLDKKVKEQQLVCSGGLYQLNKSGNWMDSQALTCTDLGMNTHGNTPHGYLRQ